MQGVGLIRKMEPGFHKDKVLNQVCERHTYSIRVETFKRLSYSKKHHQVPIWRHSPVPALLETFHTLSFISLSSGRMVSKTLPERRSLVLNGVQQHHCLR